MPADQSLVLGRAKRSTAGNRLRALLDKAHTLNAEEGFEEVEDDQDFEDNLDQKDVFDDDFASTDDEAAGDDLDPNVQERRLRKEERTQTQKEKKRNYHDPLAYLKKGPKKVAPIRKVQSTAVEASTVDAEVDEQDDQMEVEEERESKRRRVEIVLPGEEDGDPSSPYSLADEDLDSGFKPSGRRGGLGRKTLQGELRRSALRASTRKDRDEVDERAQEEQARRSVHPLRGPRKPHPNKQLTQADLIALALEREEENRESLKDWLKKEEERRLKSKEARKVVEGPRIRWISRVEGVEVSELERAEQTGEGVKQEDGVEMPSSRSSLKKTVLPGGDTIVVVKRPLPHPSIETVQPPVGLDGVPENIEPVAVPVASSSSPKKVNKVSEQGGEEESSLQTSEKPISGVKAKVPGEAPQEGPYARNYLVLEEIDDLKAEMDVVFGDHVDWTKIPVVSIRNRIQTRRKPICSLTGRPASYRHPATHISYASKDAYRAIENVLKGAYRWSADHNAFLDFEGTGIGNGEIEVADGLLDEVEGWTGAYRSERRGSPVAVNSIIGQDGGTDDPPQNGDPFESSELVSQVTTRQTAPIVEQEESFPKNTKKAPTPAKNV